LKVAAVSYAVKTVLLLGLWLAAPDVLRRGRDKAGEIWQSWTGRPTPASSAIGTAFPHAAAAAAVGTVAPRVPAPAPER